MFSKLTIFLQTIETITSLVSTCAEYIDLSSGKKNWTKILSTISRFVILFQDGHFCILFPDGYKYAARLKLAFSVLIS